MGSCTAWKIRGRPRWSGWNARVLRASPAAWCGSFHEACGSGSQSRAHFSTDPAFSCWMSRSPLSMTAPSRCCKPFCVKLSRKAKRLSCPPTSCGKPSSLPRTSRCSIADRWHFTAHARRKWSPTPVMCMRDTVRVDEFFSPGGRSGCQRFTRRASHQRSHQRFVRLCACDSDSLQFRVRAQHQGVQEISGGLLWIVFAFAGTLILNRSFARELPNDCLDALISAPIPGAALFLGKAIANFVLVLAVELVSLPVFGIFYSVDWTKQIWELLLVLLLGTWGLTVIGTIFSALTVNIRLREVMLPMLTYPIMVPALLGAMQLTAGLVTGKPIGPDNVSWLKMLAGFDLIYTAASMVLVETVLVG